MIESYIVKHLQLGIKKAFEKSHKASIVVVGPNQELVKWFCKDLPLYHYNEMEITDCIKEFNSDLNSIIPELVIERDVQYVVVNEIAHKYNLFVIDGSLAAHNFAFVESVFASKVCDLFPFLEYSCQSLDIPDFELLPGVMAHAVDRMIVEDSKHNIISCKNPMENKHWARMTGEQRILIARLHQIRKEQIK